MKMKKWSSQWTQFMQLRKEAWKKIQDFNGVWTRELAITGAILYQLSYEATDVGSRLQLAAIFCLYIYSSWCISISFETFFLRNVILTHPRSWKGESKEKNVNKIVVGLQCQGRRTLNKLKKALVIWHSNALLWKWCLFVDLAESYAVSFLSYGSLYP